MNLQLTDSEWFTVESALGDAMAFYRYQAANLNPLEAVENIQKVGHVLKKIRHECLKAVERGAHED